MSTQVRYGLPFRDGHYIVYSVFNHSAAPNCWASWIRNNAGDPTPANWSWLPKNWIVV